MTSTETVNLDQYIKTFKEDPEITDEHKEEALKFVNNVAAEGIGDSQQRKYLYSFKIVFKKFAPEGFQLKGATENEIRTVMAEVHRSDYSGSVRRMIGITLKRYYKIQNGGEVPDKAEFIDTVQGNDSPVTTDDLFTESERRKLFSAFRSLRDRAFAVTLYESAARPGELLNCSISDVDFNEKGDFIHLEGSKGTPDRTNQLISAGQDLRQWIKHHPAGGDIHEPKNPSAPLWVKEEQTSCKQCGETPQTHDSQGCDEYQPPEYERMNYHGWYRLFKRGCEKAGITDHRPYDFRHTRITEVSQFMSHEQLCKFAGWVPGSDRAKVYVHLTNDDVNRAIREEYGLKTGEDEREKVVCEFCGAQNKGGSFECRNCKRPLSLETAEKKEELENAVEIYNKIEEEGGIEQMKKLETLVDNADKIEQLVEG